MKSETFLFVVAAFVALIAAWVLPTGCGIQTHGLGNGGGGGNVTTCNDASQCDDQNPCTVDVCGAEKTCVSTPVADGLAPDEQQKPGDCQTVSCVGGQAQSQEEKIDTPADDDNECTLETCEGGVPVHAPRMDGDPCQVQEGYQGVCQVNDQLEAECVVRCTDAGQCPTMDPCTTGSCDALTSVCIFSALQDGTPVPGVTQAPGDCHAHICLNGKDTNQVDDSDVPSGTECTSGACTNGAPSIENEPVNTACTNGFCNNVGICVVCEPDTKDCDGDETNQCEASLLTDALNCGTCGDGQVCDQGVCKIPCGDLFLSVTGVVGCFPFTDFDVPHSHYAGVAYEVDKPVPSQSLTPGVGCASIVKSAPNIGTMVACDFGDKPSGSQIHLVSLSSTSTTSSSWNVLSEPCAKETDPFRPHLPGLPGNKFYQNGALFGTYVNMNVKPTAVPFSGVCSSVAQVIVTVP